LFQYGTELIKAPKAQAAFLWAYKPSLMFLMHMFWTCSSHLYVLHAVYFSLRQPIYMSMSTTVWLPPASWHCVVVQAQTSTWPNQLLLLVWVNVCATVAFRWRAGRGREYERFETVHCLQPIHFAGMYYRSTLIYPPLVNPPYSL